MIKSRSSNTDKANDGKPSAKNRRAVVIALITLTAILLPFIFAGLSLLLLPDAYSETFLGELGEKYRLLKNTESPKIVIIGGSSVAFGIDSAEIEGATGMKVVNFGLYATLGTKLMTDLARDFIKKGDIVIFSPEIDSQTLSLYFNAESAWQGLGSDLSMLAHVGHDDLGALAGGLPGYLAKLWEYALEGRKASPSGIYRRDSFNSYGDISVAREYNVMTYGYDRSAVIELDQDVVDPEFTEYIRRWRETLTINGARVFFSYCPMNREAIAPGTDDASLLAFHSFIASETGCEMLGDPNDSIMDWGYFYDTNFHLNDAGVKVYTSVLINNILRETGSASFYLADLPEPPGKKPVETADPSQGTDIPEDPREKYFVFSELGGSMIITGTAPEARYMTSLEIPRTAGGMPVIVLAAGALKECGELTSLTIRENLTLIEDGAFEGCAMLTSLSLKREEADNLEVSDRVFEGASPSLSLLLYTQTSYDSFSTGYWWAHHAARMKLVS